MLMVSVPSSAGVGIEAVAGRAGGRSVAVGVLIDLEGAADRPRPAGSGAFRRWQKRPSRGRGTRPRESPCDPGQIAGLVRAVDLHRDEAVAGFGYQRRTPVAAVGKMQDDSAADVGELRRRAISGSVMLPGACRARASRSAAPRRGSARSFPARARAPSITTKKSSALHQIAAGDFRHVKPRLLRIRTFATN